MAKIPRSVQEILYNPAVLILFGIIILICLVLLFIYLVKRSRKNKPQSCYDLLPPLINITSPRGTKLYDYDFNKKRSIHKQRHDRSSSLNEDLVVERGNVMENRSSSSSLDGYNQSTAQNGVEGERKRSRRLLDYFICRDTLTKLVNSSREPSPNARFPFKRTSPRGSIYRGYIDFSLQLQTAEYSFLTDPFQNRDIHLTVVIHNGSDLTNKFFSSSMTTAVCVSLEHMSGIKDEGYDLFEEITAEEIADIIANGQTDDVKLKSTPSDKRINKAKGECTVADKMAQTLINRYSESHRPINIDGTLDYSPSDISHINPDSRLKVEEDKMKWKDVLFDGKSNEYDCQHYFVTDQARRTNNPTFEEGVRFNIPLLDCLLPLISSGSVYGAKNEMKEETRKSDSALKFIRSIRKRSQDFRAQFRENFALKTPLEQELIIKILMSWDRTVIQNRLNNLFLKIVLYAKTKIGGVGENGEVILKLGDIFHKRIVPEENSQTELNHGTPKMPISLVHSSQPRPNDFNPSDKSLETVEQNIPEVITVRLKRKLGFEAKLKGQILISLKYLPTAGRLQITFKQLKNIVFPVFTHDIQGLYIKTSLCINRKLVKMKKTPVHTIVSQITLTRIPLGSTDAYISRRRSFSSINGKVKRFHTNSSPKTSDSAYDSALVDDGYYKYSSPSKSPTKSILSSKESQDSFAYASTARKLKHGSSMSSYGSKDDNALIPYVSILDDHKLDDDLIYMLNREELRYATLFICLVALDPNNPYSMFKKFTLGSCIQGLKGSAMAREHWEAMMSNMREPILKWHELT